MNKYKGKEWQKINFLKMIVGLWDHGEAGWVKCFYTFKRKRSFVEYYFFSSFFLFRDYSLYFLFLQYDGYSKASIQSKVAKNEEKKTLDIHKISIRTFENAKTRLMKKYRNEKKNNNIKNK